MRLISLFFYLLGHAFAMDTTSITMQPAEKLYGDTFDKSVYGKDIMFLLWDSTYLPSKLFKTSKWDMLYTEKDKWVRSRNVTIAEVDCHHQRSQMFCKHFSAFDTSELWYPIIGYSIKNEPYKHYNESMEYPNMTKFLYEYFERSCVYNENWCTEEERKLISNWSNLTILEQLKLHHAINKETNISIQKFENNVHTINLELQEKRLKLLNMMDDDAFQKYERISKLKKEHLLREHEIVQAFVNKQDANAMLLNQVIQENDPEKVKEALKKHLELQQVDEL